MLFYICIPMCNTGVQMYALALSKLSFQDEFLVLYFTEIVQRWIDNALGNKTDGILFVIYQIKDISGNDYDYILKHVVEYFSN